MPAKVKVSLPTIENRLKKLRNIDKILFQVATRFNLLLQQNWDKGRGADGNKMPKLTKSYAARKVKTRRAPIRNLVFSGLMRQGLTIERFSKVKFKSKFVNSQIPKARGNAKYSPSMMVPISDRIDRKLQKLAFRLWTKE